MRVELQLGDLAVDVVRKDIKNVHLSVHPPTGRATIAAPLRLSLDTIRVFAVAKLGWIRKQQKKLLAQEREMPREYLNRESHHLWGQRYLLQIIEGDSPASMELSHRRMVARVRRGWPPAKTRELLETWYREQLKAAIPALVARWEPLLGVHVERFFVQRMKTRWGSCNPRARTLRLNTDLAQKPRACLEYIVLHEMVHLREPTHNARFVALMNQFMPQWRSCRDVLNRLPVRHERWSY